MAIKTAVLDTQEAPTKWFAAKDRHLRNSVNKSLYSAKQVGRAIRLADALRDLYDGTFYDEPSYGTTGISVKVGNPSVKRKALLAAYEKSLEAEGITKKVTAQGILYRIKK